MTEKDRQVLREAYSSFTTWARQTMSEGNNLMEEYLNGFMVDVSDFEPDTVAELDDALKSISQVQDLFRNHIETLPAVEDNKLLKESADRIHSSLVEFFHLVRQEQWAEENEQRKIRELEEGGN